MQVPMNLADFGFKVKSNKNDIVTITALERDRLTRIGQTLDGEVEAEEEEQ